MFLVPVRSLFNRHFDMCHTHVDLDRLHAGYFFLPSCSDNENADPASVRVLVPLSSVQLYHLFHLINTLCLCECGDSLEEMRYSSQ